MSPAPPRTTRAWLVLRDAGLVTTADDHHPLVLLVSAFLVRRPTWLSALDCGVAEAEALWAVQWLVRHGVPEEKTHWRASRHEKELTPMHRAARRGFLSVVAFLYEHGVVGSADRALPYAVQHGHTEVVKFLCEHPCKRDEGAAISMAVQCGFVEIVEYLHETVQQPLTVDHWATAVQNGHLNVLKYVYARLPLNAVSNDWCPLVDVMSFAVHRQFIDIVKWLHEHIQDARACSMEALVDAANSKGYDVVQFVLDKQYDVDYADVMDSVAGSGDFQMVKLFHNKSSGGCTIQALDNAAASGNLEIVRFLNEQRAEGCTTVAMDEAATRGSLDVVEYLHEHRKEGCTTAAMDYAATNGHLLVVQFLHEHRTEGCTTAAMDGAALNGHLPVVQFINECRTDGCTTAAVDGASENGHFDIVKYLTMNRAEGSTTRAIDGAAANGHLEIVRLLHELGSLCTTNAMDQAARNGHLEVVRFLHDNRKEGCTYSALEGAALRGHLDVVQFLQESHRCDVVVSNAVIKACTSNKWLDLLGYLHHQHLVRFSLDDFLSAVVGEQIEMIEFLYNACVANADPDQRSSWMGAAVEDAVQWRLMDVVILLDSKRLEGEVYSTRAIQLAAQRGYLDLAEYLLMHGHGGSTVELMDLAAATGRMDLVRFLHESRSDGCTYLAMERAARYGHLDVVRFLHENRSEGCIQQASRFAKPVIADTVAAMRCRCKYCLNGGLDPVTSTLPPWEQTDFF